ncbi:hypothetical protein GQX74_012816 [Glossina fuscipes]|nr:hypothetical protein GQX74_012816 [Glossina fuscipes]
MNILGSKRKKKNNEHIEEADKICYRSIKLNSSVHNSITDMDDVPDIAARSEPLATTSKEFPDHRNNNKDINRSSLIIIDQDELLNSVYVNNEAQVIQKIIDEYESRLQEQLALAKADIVYELEQQIQSVPLLKTLACCYSFQCKNRLIGTPTMFQVLCNV